jgi:predicted nucleic acid-binding Zn ribbon protein
MARSPIRPSSLADALQSYVRATPLLAKRLEAASAVDAWAEAVGPQIASVATAYAVAADGTLFVNVATAGWMSELTMMERELLSLLNPAEGPPRVRKIRWQLARK